MKWSFSDLTETIKKTCCYLRSFNTSTNDLSIATSQLVFLQTEVGKLWKAINAIQNQMATVCRNVTQLFKNNVEFVVNRATNHRRYFMQKMLNFVRTQNIRYYDCMSC